MRRHLTLSEAEAALGRGKQVEQFLGGFRRDDDWIVRYLVIRPEKGTFVVTRYECLDEGHFVGTNIVFFTSASHPDDDPEDFSFSSFDEAVAFAQKTFGAKTDKFVNQGVCEEKYRDYFLSRSVTHSQKSKYATFNSSLSDDSQEIGNKFIQPGLNVASRVQEGLKMRGYPVTDVDNYEDYGSYFTAGPIGLFRLKPCVGCLFQSEGENKWLLTTEQSRGSVIFKDDAYYKRVLDDITAILLADPAFTNLNWLSEEKYNGPKSKWDVVFEPIANIFPFCMALLVIFLASLPQFGFVLAIIFFISLVTNFASDAAFGYGYYDNHKWPLFFSLIISGIIVWSIGCWKSKNSEQEKIGIDQKTGGKKDLKKPTVVWLVWPMKYWAAAILAVGLIGLVYTRDELAVTPPKVIEPSDRMCLFEGANIRYKISAESPEAHAIKGWRDAHPTGWTDALVTFSPSEMQLDSEFYGIEILGDDIILNYQRNKDDDPDNSITVKRKLSSEEQAFWKSLIFNIEKNNAAEHYKVP